VFRLRLARTEPLRCGKNDFEPFKIHSIKKGSSQA
jgi:hypothetical protein